MAIESTYIVPHPPLIIPQVGRGMEEATTATIKSYKEIAERIAEIAPELIIFISPHSVSYEDYIHIAPWESAGGNFADFGAEGIAVELKYDRAMLKEIESLCKQEKFPAGSLGERTPALDHGVMIPAYFINERYSNYSALRVSISGLSYYEHYRFGEYLGRAIEKLGRKTVIIASGDLSHRLSEKGPYGFNKAAPFFDAKIKIIIAAGDFGELLEFSEEDCHDAGECGLKSFIIMAGAIDGKSVAAELLSYEAPYGVGYAVGSFDVNGEDEGRKFGQKLLAKINEQRKIEAPYVRLARKSLEAFVKGEKFDEDTSNEIFKLRAAVFVSIKKGGKLRGCIGTIYPMCANIAEEIKKNAISAGTKDGRFDKVEAFELEELLYSVDVLTEPEMIKSENELDAKRYGVIVTTPLKTGLLLPDLDGVESAAEQLRIARSKAGIDAAEDVEIFRFMVQRYSTI